MTSTMTDEQIERAIYERVSKKFSSAKMSWHQFTDLAALQVSGVTKKRVRILVADPSRQDELTAKFAVWRQAKEEHDDR